MEDNNISYFITPKGNFVKGTLDGGKIINAEYITSKSNIYSTPLQLQGLMKEREDLSYGKLALKPISRANLPQYNINATITNNKINGGNINEVFDNNKVSTETINGGKSSDKSKGKTTKKSNPSSIRGGEVESITPDVIDAGIVDSIVGGKQVLPIKTSAKPSSMKKFVKKSTPLSTKSSVKGGTNNFLTDESVDNITKTMENKPATLASIFKEITSRLAQQTTDLITSGGNPEMLLKNDIKFYNN